MSNIVFYLVFKLQASNCLSEANVGQQLSAGGLLDEVNFIGVLRSLKCRVCEVVKSQEGLV